MSAPRPIVITDVSIFIARLTRRGDTDHAGIAPDAMKLRADGGNSGQKPEAGLHGPGDFQEVVRNPKGIQGLDVIWLRRER